MQRASDILIVSGNQIIPRKLESKLSPLLALRHVSRAYLVGARPYVHPKVRSFYPKPRWSRNSVLVHIWKVLTVLTVLVKHNPSVVVTVGLIPHGIYTLLLATLFRRKKIYLSMGMKELIYSEKGRLARAIRRIAFLSDLIGTRGTHSKAQLVRYGFKADRIFILHNVFDFDSFRPVACEKIYDLIYVGLLEPYKRVDLLLETVQRLILEKGMKTIRLAIVGKGSLKGDLQRQARTLGIYENVYFLPFGDADHVCQLLNRSRIFVMTSQSEGLPMAMIEAMSCGLPAVVFDHADIRDVAVHGKNSLLCPVDDMDCFVASIERLLKNRQLYDELSRSAADIREWKRDDYSVDFVQQVWKDVLAAV
jgi:glycosyltransferase involved in cell wall biosynthesis